MALERPFWPIRVMKKIQWCLEILVKFFPWPHRNSKRSYLLLFFLRWRPLIGCLSSCKFLQCGENKGYRILSYVSWMEMPLQSSPFIAGGCIHIQSPTPTHLPAATGEIPQCRSTLFNIPSAFSYNLQLNNILISLHTFKTIQTSLVETHIEWEREDWIPQNGCCTGAAR